MRTVFSCHPQLFPGQIGMVLGYTERFCRNRIQGSSMSMRLDKYLSQATGISRKDIRRLMRRDEVSLNGEPVSLLNYQHQ